MTNNELPETAHNVVAINRNEEEEDAGNEAARITELGVRAYVELRHKYRLLLDNKGQTAIAQVITPGVMQCVSKDDVIFCDLIKRWGNELKPSKVRNELYPRWYAEMRTQPGATIPYEDVKPFRFKSDMAAGWAWQRLTFDPNEDAKIPKLFEVLMSRTSPTEARSVVLFIGSLFDYASARHQYLYLHGLGGDGKSTLLGAMYAMFQGKGVTTMQGNSLDNTHATADLEGVRLLAFPDCNRPSLPSTGNFKEVTGEAMVGVNPKNQGRRNIKMHCKVVISSNDPPQLAGGNADMRRIIPVTFERKEYSSNQAWVDEFVGSAPAIAQYCIAQYTAWRKDNPGDLPTSDDAMENVRENSTEATATDLVDRLFGFEPGAFVRNSVLQDTLKRGARGDERLVKQAYKVLTARGYKTRLINRKNTPPYRGWEGVKVHDIAVMD